jgi:hypothetical protein
MRTDPSSLSKKMCKEEMQDPIQCRHMMGARGSSSADGRVSDEEDLEWIIAR